MEFFDFRTQAACSGMQDLFDNGRRTREQLAICATCTVKQQCANIAKGLIADGFQPYGTFGGKVYR